MNHRLWRLAWLLAATACGGLVTAAEEPHDADVATDAGVVSDARADGSPFDAGLVPACVDESPFTSEACNTALTARCRAFASERDCQSADLVGVETSARFSCGWTKVTTFSDVTTCAVASIEGRCDAYYVFPGRCDCLAYPATSVLVQGNCTSSVGGTSGPITRDWLFEVQRNDTRDAVSCGSGLSTPAPAMCACSEACSQ